jgi:nitrate reductase delta subunit
MNAELLDRLADVLEYPGAGTVGRCAELTGDLEAERPGAAQAMAEFVTAAGSLSPTGLEETYAATFDLNPAGCLHVGYHLFGESYKRGAFMAKLNSEYRAIGFDPGNELPDHLPVVLRYLAALDDAESRQWLLEEAVLPALSKIAKAFDGTANIYGALLRSALLALQPPGYVPPKDKSRALPVLGPVEHTSREWDHGKHF